MLCARAGGHDGARRHKRSRAPNHRFEMGGKDGGEKSLLHPKCGGVRIKARRCCGQPPSRRGWRGLWVSHRRRVARGISLQPCVLECEETQSIGFWWRRRDKWSWQGAQLAMEDCELLILGWWSHGRQC